MTDNTMSYVLVTNLIVNSLQTVLVIVVLVALRRSSVRLARDRAESVLELSHRADGLSRIADALRESEDKKTEGLRRVADDLKLAAESTASVVIEKIEEIKQTSLAAHDAANHTKAVIEKQYNVAAERAKEAALTDPLPQIQKTGEDTNLRVQKLEQKILDGVTKKGPTT